MWNTPRISDPIQEEGMASLEVEAARIPDRDKLLELLVEQGLDARPVNEVGIEIPCDTDDGAACDELLTQVEGVVMDVGAPFVPVKHEGVIYVRPPVG
jgi:hypothetical protein